MLEMKRILSKLIRSIRHPKSSAQDVTLCATAAPSQPAAPAPAPLEQLPPEVRRLLLSFLAFDELRALVHASPTFHQQYLADRRSLLIKCLETTLGSVAVDAWAVFESSSSTFSDTCTREHVTHLLKSYQDRRSFSLHSILTEESFTEDDIVAMVTFFSSIIKPLVQYYVAWALANLSNETKHSQGHDEFCLSTTEEIRLIRSLYRFQLCCNLFGVRQHKNFGRPRLNYASVEILQIFFCIFEPWEVEEIACIYTFAQEKYDQIFRDIRWDVHQDNPKFDNQHRPPTPDGAFDLDNTYTRQRLLIGTISCGLKLLHSVFNIRQHAQLVSTMQEHISWPEGNFLVNEALGDTAQFMRREAQLSIQDQKQERRDPLPFNGDHCGSGGGGEPDGKELYPPLAWTLIWHGTYSNLYGWYVPDELRHWGYVMWDAARLERNGGKELVMRQWIDYWDEDYDPRDDLMS